jgi:4-amino-4-deoxy-L-arabinose transferase-like glycosyltransferase
VAGLGALGAFALMADNGQLRWGVPLGIVCVLGAVWGVMDLLGTFDDPAERVVAETTLGALAPRLFTALLAACAFAAALTGAQAGVGPSWAWGALVTALFVASVAAIFRLGQALGLWATDETGAPRPLMRRHGFWIVVVAGLLYLPTLGSASLWDPWETHYGEVSREILSRDDWISLWWVQEGWFVSKPVLEFWMQALAMASLGTHYHPGEMLLGAAGHVAHPEWALRTPNVLLSIAALYALYKGVARVFGRRAGTLGAVVLMTMPDWLFLAHQTITDMPFVASMSCAMGLLLLGFHADEGATVRVYRIRAGRLTFGLTGWHLVFGAILACVIPQILYLASRNLELVVHGAGPYGLHPHSDLFKAGSAGNCGLPGNEACHGVAPTVHGFEPALQALLWTALTAGLLYLNWDERRVRRLLFMGAWFFAAVSTMAKGPAGFVLPAVCVFAYLATKKRWSDVLSLELVSGVLVIVVMAIPWYVAMYVRLGSYFTDQLIFHHMVNRAIGHVHDTNEGDDTSFIFYVWQLGYAVFPWTGLVPLGLLRWMRRGDSADHGRGDVSVFLAMWFLFAFALFSFMGTKFHHYIFPAVPPLAMLVGIVLDDMSRRTEGKAEGDLARIIAHDRTMLGGAALAGACVLLLVTRDLAAEGSHGEIRLLQLFTYNYRRVWPDTLEFGAVIGRFGIAAMALAVGLAVVRVRRYAVVGMVAVGVAWGVFVLDVYMIKTAPHWGQRDVIAAYYTDRKTVDEPLVGYQMNWKGETFYTGNRIATFVSTGTPFTTWMKQERDKGIRTMYFVLEPNRMGGLRAEVGAKAYREVTDRALCNKFILVRAEL